MEQSKPLALEPGNTTKEMNTTKETKEMNNTKDKETKDKETKDKETGPASGTKDCASTKDVVSAKDGTKEAKDKDAKEIKLDSAKHSTAPTPLLSSSPEATDLSSSKLDKAILSNLNKSLKVKQKIINTKEPQPKNSALISEIINRSPQSSTFPNNISNPAPPNLPNPSLSNTNPPLPNDPNATINSLNSDIDSIPNLPPNEPTSSAALKDAKKAKKVAKQNSTRTDFFAAKLASAVDDVDTSDSDETFVYENNINDEFDENNDSRTIDPNTNGSNDRELDAGSDTNVLENNEAPVTDDEQSDTPLKNASTSHANGTNNPASINLMNNDNENNDNDQSSIDNVDSPPSTMNHRPEPIDLSNIPKNLDSMGSAHSIKHPSLKAPKPINKPIPNASLNNSSQFLDNLVNKPLRPPNQRSMSSYSVQSNSQQLPVPNYDGEKGAPSVFSNASPNQTLKHSSNPSDFDRNSYNDATDTSDHEQRTTNPTSGSSRSSNTKNMKSRKQSQLKSEGDHDIGHDADNDDNDVETNLESELDTNMESNDESEDGDDEEDEVDVDDVSSHDSYNSSKMISSSNTTLPQKSIFKPTASNKKNPNLESTNSITSKTTSSNKKKSTTSSSKLRSTTSKLFDKKGAQPRRYSIVPDDIDIEDFDDELFYYDNNVRFPYNSNNSLNFNEQSPLINNQQQPSKIPHYRSLNLNPNAAGNNNQQRNKSKRYLSTGQYPFNTAPNTPPHQNPNTNNNANGGNGTDIFPFPYPEQQRNQNPYYFGFDEYDDETGSINEHQFDKVSRKASSKFNFGNRQPHDSPYNNNSNFPHLSSNNHFLLPRKNSFMKSDYNYVKRILYTLISIIGILTIGFIMGFVIATTKDLSNVAITDIQNPVVSQDELVFNIMVEALNPGWFTVDINDVELDIFAKSGYLPDVQTTGKTAIEKDYNSVESTVETVLLGSVFNLESVISFPGGFFNRDLMTESGEIKLLSPGKNLTNFNSLGEDNGNGTTPDNSAKWEIISKNPFNLIIRGTLKYNLPLTKSTKSVVVTKTSYIDPTIDND